MVRTNRLAARPEPRDLVLSTTHARSAELFSRPATRALKDDEVIPRATRDALRFHFALSVRDACSASAMPTSFMYAKSGMPEP